MISDCICLLLAFYEQTNLFKLLTWNNEAYPRHFSHLSSTLYLQFIREYTGKVDELVKDKIEAQKEVKAKEQEEKDVIAQQVIILHPGGVKVHGVVVGTFTFI